MRWPTWKQKQTIFTKLGYRPNEGQIPAHRSRARVVLVAGGERSGKSCWTAREILARIPWCERVAIAAQEYDECRAEMQTVVEGLRRLRGLVKVSTPQHGKWRAVVRGGIEVETISLHEGPQELTGRGLSYDVVALVEAGRIRYDAFLAARGRVAESRGVVLLSGTLWDNFGWYADLFRSFEGPNVFEGQRFSIPTWVNREIFPGGRQDAEIVRMERMLPSDEFARRVAARLVPSPARIYPEFSFAEHVAEIEYDPELPVELAIDAGYYPSRYAVLALQVAEEPVTLPSGSVVRMDVLRQIDEVWEWHKTHQDVYEMCTQREWWEGVERIYGGHETRQHQAAESTREVWETLTRADGRALPFEVVDGGRILDGVVRLKTMLRDPATNAARYRCDVKCTGTQGEFGSYKRKTDAKGNVVSDQPEDRNNDALDALRNYVIARFGWVDAEERRPKPGRRWKMARG